MNPEKKPPMDFTGHIPRKKKPLPTGGAEGAASSMVGDGGPPRSSALADMPIPRKKTPKIILHRAMDEESSKSSSGGVGGGASPRCSLGGSGRSNEHPRRADDGSGDRNPVVLGKSGRIRVVCEAPFIVRIKTKGIPMLPSAPTQRSLSPRTASGGSSRASSVARAPAKRQRPDTVSYKELEDTDEDDFMTEAEEQELLRKRVKKRRKKRDNKEANSDDADGSASDGALLVQPSITTVLNPNAIEAPPPGVLSTLWYSRECFLHVFVMEKICGWKTRPKVQLAEVGTEASPRQDAENEGGDTKPASTPLPLLDLAEASRLQHKALSSKETWSDPKRRMDISRIHPTNCPVILSMAAAESQKRAFSDPGKKRLEVHPVPTPLGASSDSTASREEVLLVKWRGRSYMHCSWERASDIQRLDPSTSNIARSKLRKFYQTQEAIYGPKWKQVLEEERMTAAAIHSHGKIGGVEKASPLATAVVSEENADQDEEYFPPQFLEVERILACDENEMNMEVLAKQRALNIRDEEEEMNRIEQERDFVQQSNSIPDSAATAEQSRTTEDDGRSWDPEDNVRYVVKWKGLPYAEITWEYWRDVKTNAVDEAEDFWYRQRAPDLEEVRRLSSRPHPHMRDFKKLQESPAYGVSEKPRPVATFGPDVDKSLPAKATDPGFRLRSYQLEGVNWLLFNWWNRRSCILADEMGLGKTIQSAAFLQELQTQPAAQVRGPFLIVAPLSLIGQWQSELQSWAPDLNVILYHGSADARDFLVQQEFYYTDQFVPRPTAIKLKKQHVTKFHVLITTYEVVLKDIAVLSKIRWKTLIVDEAHRLKNHKAKLFEELASVPRDHCVLLTGTPIANATEELWALLHFANPRTFADRDAFLEKFGEMTESKQVNELHALLKPYLLRRVKEDVEKSIPNKEETILEVSLTPTQKTFYKAIYERNTSFLFKGAKPNNSPSLMNVVMELRKCCNHPFLVKGAEDRILDEAAAKLKGDKDEQGIDTPTDYAKLFGEQLVKASGKMVLMEKLLQKLFDGGHKVLVFSQMVRALDLLEELLKLKKYRYERLDGTTSSSSRLHAVERFKRPACERFVMLLSTRAGGLGLNLTAADIVIIFDSDFNPQNDLQAMARAHRIGQTRAVKVYRLLTAKTYEMHMFHTASLKLGLERAVLSQNREQQTEESDDAAKSTRASEREAQAKEIDNLLKKGAYDVFRDDDDKEAEKFMETDIDQLLENSSKTVTYGAAATSSLSSGLGSFSKASFVANTDGGEKDVDLDDPDFWSKAVGLESPPEETPEDVAAMLDDGVKRSRKQVQQYDPYAETVMDEQLKKERIALEKMLEQEEKERQKEEKRLRKNKAKEEKRRKLKEEKEKARQLEKAKNPSQPKKATKPDVEKKKKVVKLPKLSKEVRPKKTKKNDRMRALRRAENEDPAIERFKQAWDIPQRNRATATAIRFGFGRFCKVRTESNLSSLPLQDLEVFIRAYIFQLSLQVASTILSRIREESNIPDVRSLFQEWLGLQSTFEVEWLCDSIHSVMKLQNEVESGRRFLRMPLILTEPAYVTDLRHGAGFRALRRVGLLARLNSFIEDCLNSILRDLGHEELGKRGCAPNELPTLDADLKARFVTSEELALAVSACFEKLDLKAPASWWDRSCDVGLIIGTFVHGLGNYEVMLRDHSIPFADKIKKLGEFDTLSKTAIQRFRSAASAARRTFDDALDAMQVKAELEVQAAVAAAAKAAAQREKDAARVREGGAEAEVAAKNMPETQVENAFVFDGTDSHFVTLPRMYQRVQEAIRQDAAATTTTSSQGGKAIVEVVPEVIQSGDDFEPRGVGNPSWRTKERHALPMPDSRVLDYRLVRLLNEIEKDPVDNGSGVAKFWERSQDVVANSQVRERILSVFVNGASDFISEYAGVGLGGNQCGISHRSLNDGSDFSFGSASNQLAQLAYGTDAPRYLRALGVPMNVTRFAISGLVYAENSCVEDLMESERHRFYGKRAEEKSKESSRSGEACEASTDRTPVGANGTAASVKATAINAASETKSANPAKTESGDTVKGQETSSEQLEADHSSSNKPPAEETKACIPIDPVELIDDTFRQNVKLRATVCVAVIFYGFPSSEPATVNNELWQALQREGSVPTESTVPEALFSVHAFREVVATMASDVEIPEADLLQKYIERVLLPHCLRLCVSGNGPSTRNARGSEGDYETAFGISIYPEPSQPQPSPLPDPCLSLQQHSLEALGFANALLRRVRLLRSCIHLCSTKTEVPINSIVSVFRSKDMGQLQGMPVWWCPWIHDPAILFQASTRGLFSVISERSSHTVFSPEALQQLLYKAVGAQSLSAVQHSSPEHISSWVAHQANKFPSLNQLERRLGSLCSLLTADLQCEARFDSIPMFDHGAWPRD